jgi:hypothetical protein
VPLLILLNVIEYIVSIVHDQKLMSQALELQNFEVESHGVYLT